MAGSSLLLLLVLLLVVVSPNLTAAVLSSSSAEEEEVVILEMVLLNDDSIGLDGIGSDIFLFAGLKAARRKKFVELKMLLYLALSNHLNPCKCKHYSWSI